MVYYIAKDTDLKKVGDAIREKGGTTNTLVFPSGMVTAIGEIPSGGTDTFAEYISNDTFEYVVPATVGTLQKKAFRNMDRLSKIGFTDGNKAANDGSLFSGCSSLKDADLTNLDTTDCTTFAYWFYNNHSLVNLTLPKNIKKVVNISYMFQSCTSLTSLDLSNFRPDALINADFAFDGCSKLKTLDLEGLETKNITSMRYMFSSCASLEKVKGIEKWDLSKLTVNSSGVFNNCRSIDFEENYFNNTIAYIGSQFFYTCKKLTIKKVSSLLKAIGSNAFQGCSSLTTLWFPETCTSIGSNAFNNCTSLADIYTPLTERPSGWNSLAFPSTVTIHYGVSEEEYDEIIKEDA